MNIDDFTLRCYASKEQDGSWYAICLNLNIFVQADTCEQAREKLHSAIMDYIKVAVEDHGQHLKDLIPRRAPLYFYFIYYMYKIRELFSSENMGSIKTFKDVAHCR